MAEVVRAFVAIELGDDAESALAELVSRLSVAQTRAIRPVTPEGIHLTLKFLGNVPLARVDAIATEVSKAVANSRRFDLELGGVGVFPDRSRARVLWVGVGGDVPSLIDLQSDVEGAMSGLGFAKERRPYSPHLTVARVNERASATDRRLAADALFATRFQGGQRIAVTAVVLMQSILGREGAKYRRLAHIPLSGVLRGDMP